MNSEIELDMLTCGSRAICTNLVVYLLSLGPSNSVDPPMGIWTAGQAYSGVLNGAKYARPILTIFKSRSSKYLVEN